MEEIKLYLQEPERNYAKGVALLTTYGKNRHLANNLAKKENATNIQKLEYELNKLLEQPVKVEPVQVEKIKEPTLPPVTPAQPHTPATPEDEQKLAAIAAEQAALFVTRCQLSNTLADQQTDEQRRQVVDQLDAVQEDYNALAVKKNQFEQSGKFPQEQTTAPVALNELDKIELTKKRNNLRSQVSKAKTAATAKPDDVQKQEKLQKLALELDQVELQLKYVADQKKRTTVQA